MTLQLKNLDTHTRNYMVDEFQRDVADQSMYFNPRLTPEGRRDWPVLLLVALIEGTPRQLAGQLRLGEQLEPAGRWAAKDAARILSEAEFNRYYCRGVCRRAIDDGWRRVEVYWARERIAPSQDSEDLLGRLLDARWLLTDLRQPPRRAVGRVPGGPNSGLSVRLPDLQRLAA